MRRIIGFSGLAAILVSGGCAASRTYIPLSTSHGGTSGAVSKKEKAEPPRLSGLPDASSQPQGEKVDETFPSGSPPAAIDVDHSPIQLSGLSVDGGLTGQELVVGDETRVRLVSAEDGRAGMWADQIQLPAPPQIQADSVAEAGHSGVVVLDLPTALALVGGQHPVVGFAQWRVQEANARWDQAHVLWLPNLQAGTSVSRHDGQLQDTEGRIRDVNRSSLQAGLGAGAVGAGTTQYPGIAANFAISDAIFAPRIAQKTSWARQHGATTAFNDQLLRVAIAYVRLLAAKQDKLVLAEIHQRTSDLATLTRNFAETGQGLQADADRLQTETILVKNRLLESSEREQIAVARLIEAASLDYFYTIELADTTLVPLDLLPATIDSSELVPLGLRSRPELKEAQCLVAAACDEHRRQKYAPFVPSVLLGFSQTGFGGGQGVTSGNFAQRVDYDAMALWQVRNLGFGEIAARNEANARIEQARFEQLRLMDRVAREISEAQIQVVHRRERVNLMQGALQSALDSYNRNLARIRDAQGLPIEVLQSIQALEQAQRSYVSVVADYNESQFQLQWALGWPVHSAAEL